LLEECRTLKGCPTGEAKITKGYGLAAKWVIHTVGPVWNGGDHQERELLASCYASSLGLTQDNAISSVAFPAISTGVYRFPIEQATRIALAQTIRYLANHTHLAKVIFVCFGNAALQAYQKIYKEMA